VLKRGRTSLRHAFALAAILLLMAVPALAQGKPSLRGVALVIGNGGYQHLAPLTNPGDDAKAIEDLLADLGFDTTLRDDRDARALSRDLERFVEDAEDADVAVLYYAGHGIEAGGENWLVPVDADISALDAAGKKLVPLSGIVRKLQETVSVTIVLMDACRDNPFPPDALLTAASGQPPAPVAVSGLALSDSRSARPLSEPKPGNDSLGIVIGFAAEPGKVALDGAKGANSPYAAAILRHLAAMDGVEFGQVMRMVAEEVYLKTGGRQRPWTNESLRRLLYFGETPQPVAGPEGEILGERRKLLLAIADLPDPERRRVEKIAGDGGVPMDAVYAMLEALGQDRPGEPAALDALLREQAERLKEMTAERSVLKSADPEIARLSALADEAIGEGALQTALSLHEQAKSRIGEKEKTLADAEADLKARRLEGAEVFAASAAAYEVAFDFRKAADDYGQAFAQAERWDRERAWLFRSRQVLALTRFGNHKGDNAAYIEAIDIARQTLSLVSRDADPVRWATTQNNLAAALQFLGNRENGTARFEEAIAAYRAALTELDPQKAAYEWANTQNNLGTVSMALGQRESGTGRLEEAAVAFRAALTEFTREEQPMQWANAQNNLGAALWAIGQREPGTERLGEAISAFRAALEIYTPDRAPLERANTQNNLGLVLWTLSQRQSDPENLHQSVAVLRSALEYRTRERMPYDWAMTQNNLGLALMALARREGSNERFEEATQAFRQALLERTRERAPLDWANSQGNLGLALWHLARNKGDIDLLRQSIAAYRLALQETTREHVPLDWANTQNSLSLALWTLGQTEQGNASLDESIAGYRAALEVMTRERVPLEWANTQVNLGLALWTRGLREQGTSTLKEAVAAFHAALEEQTRERVPLDWANTQNNLGIVLRNLSEREEGTAALEEAISAFRAAAEIMTRQRNAIEWADLQVNLGMSWLNIARRKQAAEPAAQAIEALSAALPLWEDDDWRDDDTLVQRIAEARQLLAGTRP
jgi:uncharacterized caspase-like protein